VFLEAISLFSRFRLLGGASLRLSFSSARFLGFAGSRGGVPVYLVALGLLVVPVCLGFPLHCSGSEWLASVELCL